MLTPMDDYLIHQTTDTIDRVATSDRNFYDRYYFNCHDLTGEVFLVVGMAVYPNRGIIDAFATAVQRNERQFAVAASRELNSDRSQTVVGPIGVEVQEGLRRLRVWCESNESGLSFDLTFEGTAFPYEEPRFFRRAGSRIMMDTSRLTQPGQWTGKLSLGGEEYQVQHESWRGARDHSWGIRPVGDPEPASAPARNGTRGFYWNWAPIHFPDYTLLYMVAEEADGSRWCKSAARVYPYDAGRAPDKLEIVRHEIRLKRGTRVFDGGVVVFREPGGRELSLELEPLSLLHMAGVGYSYGNDFWHHGQYHGELEVKGITWDLTDAESVTRISGHKETVCRAQFDGQTGHGIFELIIAGLYDPYGFKTPADVAQ